MLRSALSQFQNQGYKSLGAAATLASISAVTATLFTSVAFLETNTQDSADNKCMGIIETNLMDKIANKPYLNCHHVPMVVPTYAINASHKDRSSALSAQKPVVTGTNSDTRPKGVPKKVRVLVIDVPQFRNVFDRECYVDLTMVSASVCLLVVVRGAFFLCLCHSCLCPAFKL